MARTCPRYAQLAIRRHASLWLPVPGPAFMVSASVLSPGCRRLLELSFLSLGPLPLPFLPTHQFLNLFFEEKLDVFLDLSSHPAFQCLKFHT
jgi:hypothetical protein